MAEKVSPEEGKFTDVEASDLNALLGKDIVEKLVRSNKTEKKNELQVAGEQENNVGFVNDKTKDLINQLQETSAIVLGQIQMTPDDEKLLNGAASLIKAQTGLLKVLNDANLLDKKFEHQAILQNMKNTSDAKINKENNQTKILLSRSEMFMKLREEEKKNAAKKDDVVDID